MGLRKHIFFSFILLLVPLAFLAQESEEQLRQDALALFESEDYDQAFTKYSQLLSLNLQSPEYNFRFGACQLYTSKDKEEALKYLKFAAENEQAPALAFFYYGLGLHLNYRFEKAIQSYENYRELASKKEKESKLVDHHIEQCRSGIELVSQFTDISVIQREVLPRTDFYRNYDLSEFGGKIIVKPEDFMSDEDKKRDAKFLMYFQQEADYIYYASFSDKNATGKDLYFIQKIPGGEWSQPSKLSDVINTPFDEDYPFIHPDGNVLYFASKGHNSMGGYDIFKSKRKGDGSWTKPENMEFAINTPWDDFMFITDKEENTAWFASNRETSSKQVTVYRIGIQRIPLDLTLIKGTFEAEGSRKAKITVEDMVQDKVLGVFESERQLGDYLIDLRGSGKYRFIVEAEESNAVHTGLVEVPRDKGLKQFRQEMKLVMKDGKEQLQIINHFDEPLTGDESLLTADILKKQANLSINSSEDDLVRTTELLDDPGTSPETTADEGLTQEQKLAQAQTLVSEMESDAVLMNKKATHFYNIAEEKSKSSDPDALAEAAIAAELANDYKQEAAAREAALDRMKGTLGTLENAGLQDAAFNAQYNQLKATGQNFDSMDDFESRLKKSYEARKEPSVDAYEEKAAEVSELQDDVSGIDEEISYYESEIENTKDDAVKEELGFQLEEAKAARPEKEASLNRAKTELTALEKQKNNAIKYGELTSDLLFEAISKAPSVTPGATVVSINQLQTTLSSKAASDPALVAFIAPESVRAATEAALAESRKAGTGEEPEETATTEESTAEKTPPTTPEVVEETPSETADASPEPIETTTEPATSEEPSIIQGDYAKVIQEEITEASNAEDPKVAASRKAELYDQWANNIQYRIDSLTSEQDKADTPEQKVAISSQIIKLQTEKEEKVTLAKENYATAGIEPPAEMASSSATTSSTPTNQPNTSEQPVSAPGDENVALTESATNEGSEFDQGTDAKGSITSAGFVSSIATDALPQEVQSVNKFFNDQLKSASTIDDPIIRSNEMARINRQWTDTIGAELAAYGTQIDAEQDPERKAQLKEEAASLSTYRRELQNAFAAEAKDRQVAEREKALAREQVSLQDQLSEYIEAYNGNAFVQIRQQVEAVSDTELKKAQLETLHRNWMIALKNEELKTEARISNSTDPNQIEALNKQLVRLNKEKLMVQSTLDSLEAPVTEDGPKAPEQVVIKGSERYEGYQPVSAEKPGEYDELTQQTYAEIETKQAVVNELQAKLESTRKKKEKKVIEEELERARNSVEMAQFRSSYYEESEALIRNTEAEFLALEEGQPRPSERQSAIADSLQTEADQLTSAAAAQRAAADEIRKKKKRIPAQTEARQSEYIAFKKRTEATLARELADDMKEIETRAVEENFIIPPGQEYPLPVVTRKLNPTEMSDVESTVQFQSYNKIKQEADSFRMEAAKLEALEIQLSNRAQQKMLQPAGEPETAEQKMKRVQEAYVMYDRADSLSKEAARLKRKAAFVENGANQELLKNPEEVYNSIIAYYNSDSLQGPAAPSEAEIAAMADAMSGDQDETDTGDQEDPFNLLPPEENDARVNVQRDVLTETIFEVDKTASKSFYDAAQPIPVDPPLPNGVIYKVQIGAFRYPIKQDAFKGLKPIVAEKRNSEYTRYTAGEFRDFASADFAKDEVRQIGYPDAFVVAYRDGKRITIAEARGQAPSTASSNSAPRGSSSAPAPPRRASLPPNSVLKQGDLVVRDVANQGGTYFTVQVGVYSNPVKASDIYNITPLSQENLPNGTYRYSTGVFNNLDVAIRAKEEAQSLGVVDAFVTAYRDGKRITVEEAKQSLGGSTASTPAPQPKPQPKPQPAPQPAPEATGSYQIELGTFQGDIPISQAAIILNLSEEGVEKVKFSDGSSSYYYGKFNSREEAETRAKELVQQGLTEAKPVQR